MTIAAGVEKKGAGRLTTALLLAPAAFWFLILLILPLAVVIVYSFGERAATGGYQAGFTFANYLNLPARLTAFRNTLTLAPMGTLICLLIGYPLAYFLAVKSTAKSRLFLIILVIVPFWTSFLIRTYAWMFILGGRGHTGAARLDRLRGYPADQHALRRADRHRLRLSAADGLSDLRQPGEARQAPARRPRRIWAPLPSAPSAR